MKREIVFGSVLCLVVAIMVCRATMSGQYSVNIHFVPPLVSGRCSIAQFWNPPNITCALCFCMTGSLSRCIPQPGCDPSNATSTTTAVPSSTPETDASEPTTIADPSGSTETPENGNTNAPAVFIR